MGKALGNFPRRNLFRYRALNITIITSPAKQISGELKGSFKPFINSVLPTDFLCVWWLYTTNTLRKATIYLGWNFTQKADWDVGQDLRQPSSSRERYFKAEGTACWLLLLDCMCPRFPWLRRWTRFKAAEPHEKRYFMAEGTACCLLAPNWRSIYIFTWPAASQHNPNLLDFHLFLHIQSWEKYTLEEYNFKLQFQ